MCAECARCGHSEDQTYEFDMPMVMPEPREEGVPGNCPDCGTSADAPAAEVAGAVVGAALHRSNARSSRLILVV